MVSLQITLSDTFNNPSKKRKRDEHETLNGFSKELKIAAIDDVELQLEDLPLPPEWQRCLDIKSGRITFYNTRTRMRMETDPRKLEPVSSPAPVKLNLDLNLGTDPSKSSDESEDERTSGQPAAQFWMDCKEMVAGVCMRCHMLVMMRRTSPACPNCKFLHPLLPSGKSGELSGQPRARGFGLLSCRD